MSDQGKASEPPSNSANAWGDCLGGTSLGLLLGLLIGLSVTSVVSIVITALVALLAALVVWVIVSWWRSPYTPFQYGLYLVNTFFTRVLWRTTVSGRLPISDDQGAVIVSNHASGIDPLLIQLSTDRIVHWMVAREYF